ncbi:MAG: peptidylprolyl isomerase [Verrucomicrobiota bacterium]|jgi:parvulin-like peptidyl-prolyl isomerase|nr:peptidylprolyl isomerase [Verrucomicrobiota bacterium]
MQIWVNEEAVAPEWIEEEFAQIKSWHEQRSQGSCCERDDEFRAQAKENVIGRLLLNQDAEGHVPEPSKEEIDAALQQLHKDYGGEEAFMANLGITGDQKEFVERQVVLNLKVDQLVAGFCGELSNPSDATLRAFYELHPELYTTEGKVRALHIFKSFRQSEDKEELFRECCRMRERLVSGEDFKDLAKGFSDKPAEEIDLGFFKRGELMDEFEYVAFSMQVGEVSPVFSSYHGFHLAKVLEIEASTRKPYEEVQPSVQEAWAQEKRTQKIQEHIKQLRTKAQIREEADDSDSSS